MESEYLGRVPFARALARQEELWRRARDEGHGTLLGFECDAPTITHGKRAAAADVLLPASELARRGFVSHVVDRGGQVTLHNPGQLVLFPVFPVREWGARRWVERLAETTRRTLAGRGLTASFDPCRPGLYSARGKVAAMGLRIRQGVSTHGVSINVTNDLGDFAWISPCGVRGAKLDRLGAGALPELFREWAENFAREAGPAEKKWCALQNSNL